jgi:hypothetical protein
MPSRGKKRTHESYEIEGGREEGRKGGREEGRKGGREEGRKEHTNHTKLREEVGRRCLCMLNIL